jgi:hypothetical protein
MRFTSSRALAAAAALLLTACGGSSMGGMDHGAGSSPTASAPMQMGDPRAGLATSEEGYTFDSQIADAAPTGQTYRLRILGPNGSPHTAFAEDQTKRMHLYLVRADLTNYQHLHPSTTGDGNWSVGLPALAPGPYRVYASFIATDKSGKGHELVLSRSLSVPGDYRGSPVPPPSSSAAVDGYEVTLKGQVMSGMAMPLQVRVTRDGRPVDDLQPYLGAYAHLTAIRSGDLAFSHLHPEQEAAGGGTGGPDLSVHAQLPRPGDYRLFVQFQTGGRLHTAALTVHAAG